MEQRLDRDRVVHPLDECGGSAHGGQAALADQGPIGEPVKQAHSRRGKECKGAMTGDVSAACEKADGALGGAIVEYVRGDGNLPEPAVP